MEKARPVDLLAPIGGAMMLVSAFLEWFRYPDPDVIKLQKQFQVPGQVAESPVTMITSTAWEVTSLRYIIYLCAIAAIVNFFLLITSRTPGRSAVFSTPVFILGALTTLWIAFRWISPPFDDADALSGLYVGLAGALLVAGGSFLALRDERVPSGFDQAPAPEMLTLPDDLTSEPVPPASAPQPPAAAEESAPQVSGQPAVDRPVQQPGTAGRDESVAPPERPGS